MHSYTHDGLFMTNNEDHELTLTERLPADIPDLVRQAGFKTPTVLPRRDDSRGPEYGYYQVDTRDADLWVVSNHDHRNKLRWWAKVCPEHFIAFMIAQH